MKKLYIVLKRSKGGETLALEAINEIKKAEAQAEEMIADANKQSREIIQNAASEAAKTI